MTHRTTRPVAEPDADAPRAVWQAVALVTRHPGRDWTVGNLAVEVGLSVRRLQELFATHVGVAPLPYIREVRLEQARTRLLAAQPGEVSIERVARDLGIHHVPRFAGYYRDRYGELPSDTLTRPP